MYEDTHEEGVVKSRTCDMQKVMIASSSVPHGALRDVSAGDE